jgi:hypothetical protein
MNTIEHEVINLYKKPTCSCGEELTVHDSYGVEDYYNITADGKQSKRKIVMDRLLTQECRNLECRKCLNLYGINFDYQDRIIRGDVIEET